MTKTSKKGLKFT